MKKLNEIFDTNYEIEIQDVKTNSKEVKTGDLFVCINGFNVDRHDFIKDAEKNGAVAAVVSRSVDCNIPTIMVEDTNKELINIVNKVYDYPSSKMDLIGITGTDGKTSTSTIIYQLLNQIKKTGYIGTNGVMSPTYSDSSNNTTPTKEHLHRFLYNFYKDGCKSVVMEAGSEGLAQGRCESIMFDYSIFTNLTHEHLNFHKTMENYMEAKSILFKQTKKDGYCILNSDDPYSKDIAKLCNGNVLYYGKEDKEAKIGFMFFDIKINHDSTSFKLKYKDSIYNINTNLLGKFNVYNLTAALSIFILMGFNINDFKEILMNLSVDGRMTNIDLGQDFKVIVDYAHTPNGYLNLFELTKTLNAKRTIIVAGSAGERDKEKRPVMGKILVDNSSYVIFTYEDPRTEDPKDIINDMIQDVIHKKDKFEIIIDRHYAIKKAIEIARSGDMVLILGKGNETHEIIGNDKIYFNDIEEARRALEELKEKANL